MNKLSKVNLRDMRYISQMDTLEARSIQLEIQVRNDFKLPKILDAVCILLPLLSLFLWAISLQHVSVKNMSDLGLISVLSPRIIVAEVILTISFGLTLQRPQIRLSLLALHLILLIIMLYGVENLIEEAARFAIVYRHAGYTEYIMRTGSVDPTLDAYFSWPGFFLLSAFVTHVAGFQSILSFAGWAPVFYNLIYFGPMNMIFSSVTSNKRLIWLGLWFFYLTNWIGQDYFSPQGLNFFLYLVIIAILLKWFKISPKTRSHTLGRYRQSTGYFSIMAFRIIEWLRAPDTLCISTKHKRQWVLLVGLILIFGLVIFSHPLTPFFVLASVTALVVFRRIRPFWLPIFMAAMTGAWMFFMTQTFLIGHSSMVLGNFGKVSSNISASVTNRVVQGNPQHSFIASLRIIMTAFIWILAFIGAVRRLRKGHNDITYILLAMAPLPLIVVQDYGGEMFLRVYLFTLPPITFFAAAIFYSKHSLSIRGISLWRTVAIIAMSLILLGGFFFTRYGNERMDYMTYSEVNSVHYLYSIAQPNSLLIEGWFDTPWQYQDYEKYTCVTMADVLPNAVIHTNVDDVVQYIKSQDRSYTYLIFTRSQKVQAYSLFGVPNGALDRLESAMLKSGEFKQIYHNPDAEIFLFLGTTKGVSS